MSYIGQMTDEGHHLAFPIKIQNMDRGQLGNVAKRRAVLTERHMKPDSAKRSLYYAALSRFQ